MKRKFRTNILVRNNRIKMMEEQGVFVNYSVLSDEEYIKELKNKVIEEANEVATAPNPDELMSEIGDLLEVIEHIVEAYKLDNQKIQEYKKIKQEKVGKFDKKFKTHWVEVDDENNPKDYYKSAAYYLANPHKYPEIKDTNSNSKLLLKDNPKIQDFQEYIKQLKIERGFPADDKVLECMLMAEEVGELFSAIRKNMKGGMVGSGSVVGNVKLELADVLMYLCSIANQHGVDLEEAFREKEEINKTRTWKKV